MRLSARAVYRACEGRHAKCVDLHQVSGRLRLRPPSAPVSHRCMTRTSMHAFCWASVALKPCRGMETLSSSKTVSGMNCCTAYAKASNVTSRSPGAVANSRNTA
eukprot:4819716-Heterocapsa_arctica.AAC.1